MTSSLHLLHFFRPYFFFGTSVNISVLIFPEPRHARGRLSLCLNPKGIYEGNPHYCFIDSFNRQISSSCLISEYSGQRHGTKGVRVDKEGRGGHPGWGKWCGKSAHQIETRRSLRRFMCVVGKRGRRQGITQGCVHPSHISLEKCCFPKGIYASISGSYGWSLDLSVTPLGGLILITMYFFPCMPKAKGSRAGYHPSAVSVWKKRQRTRVKKGFVFWERWKDSSLALPGGLGSLSFCEQDRGSPSHAQR